MNVDPVVSNTTPVGHLIRIGHLSLLEKLFGQLLIPAQVAEELRRGKHVLGNFEQAPGAACLKIDKPLDGPFYRQLLVRLDEGEAAAIALALERRASLLLMDELEGRKVAALHGLRVVGTLGVLVEAKRGGYVERVKPLLERLEGNGFRIGQALKERILEAAGEGE